MYFIYLVCLIGVVTSNIFVFADLTVTDEEYYQMPDLFYLDDYPKCLSRSDNVFCQGIFEISSPKPSRVYDVVRKISQNTVRNFNHTRIHRGICLGNHGSCPLDPKVSWKENFKNCVQTIIRGTHDFDTNLIEFNGCKNRDFKRPWDLYDVMFLCYIILVIGLNFIGTSYDFFLKKDSKGNPWLLCFSLRANWKRFSYKGAPDGEYKSLHCFTAMRAILVPLILMSHILLAMMIHLVNPKDMEAITESLVINFFTGGTISMQIFIITSSFLQTFQMLIISEHKSITFKNLCFLIIDRYVRLMPMFLTAVGFSATLFPHTNDGALWSLVEKEAQQCRNTFWRQLLLMQHWYAPGCLAQTWYIAVSFQIFVICAVLMFYLLKTKSNVIRTVVNLYILNQLVVYAVVYYNELKPTTQFMNPEALLSLFSTEKSFLLLYQSLWGNLPSGFLGCLAAYIYYQMRKNKVDLKNSKRLRLVFNLSLPLIFLNIIGGYLAVNAMSSRWVISLYATLDKPLFSINVVFFIFGCLFEVDHIYKSMTEWFGWKYISRLSLGSLLFHTVHTKYQTGSLLSLQTFSKAAALSYWFANMAVTFLLVLPLVLMIEFPLIALWKTFASSGKTSLDKENVKEVEGKADGNANSLKIS